MNQETTRRNFAQIKYITDDTEEEENYSPKAQTHKVKKRNILKRSLIIHENESIKI